VRHRQNKNRYSEYKAQEKSAGDRLKFGVTFFRPADPARIQLQIHAALRAIARDISLHAGTHRAEIFRCCGLRRRNGNPTSTAAMRDDMLATHRIGKKNFMRMKVPRRISVAVLGGRSTWEILHPPLQDSSASVNFEP